MPNYLVKWDIELDADTPEHAAQLALEIQRDVNSEATSFMVTTRIPDPEWPGAYRRGDSVMVELDTEEN